MIDDHAFNTAQCSVLNMLEAIGENPAREGLVKTPERVAKAWKFMCSGYSQKPEDILTTFDAEGADEMVFQSAPFSSNCEHHMLPFVGVCHIGYIPRGRIVGLSKLPRLVDVFAKRLQVQERLGNQIADALMEHLNPEGVGVYIQCRHFCMEIRGIQKIGAVTVTSALRGSIKDHAGARQEFLSIVAQSSQGLRNL